MELNMHLKQTTTLSPQMLQSMEILQMGSQELLDYVEELVQENPTIEVEETYKKQDEFSLLKRKLEWLESVDSQNRYYHQMDTEDTVDPISAYGSQTDNEDNLYFYILSQLRLMDLPPDIGGAANYIVESLDGSGYLDEDVPAIAKRLGIPEETTARALRLVQSLDPAGIGAHSLQECLLLQLDRREGDYSLARAIIREHLDSVGKNRFGLIAKQLNVSAEQVHAACALIKGLNPRPGAGFSARENLIYINPDIFVVNFPDHFELLINDYFFPTLNISSYYRSLLKETEEDEVKEYLSGKVRQAKWVVKSIEQRRSTLLRCAECILDIQKSFFRLGPGHLVPMSLADIASRLSLHESTICRAVKDKYIQCSSGVYPLSYFFSRALSNTSGCSSALSPDHAKARIKKLIEEENKKKPLSDRKLSELLLQDGLEISRRTVAKYRDELGIPSTAGRKQYE
ncbi:RNA polymerase factor sigma-54 [Papillibacter cinnamivorans]|uniref:RNA polymerase, sigma 54 subunit, RpoN/SigL n=1 Tax=Papillibacter cinnamivorans DSM 12816 TaxID=1122930 RepID=A0A1W2A6S2_9FIRM|nr:RNA polymerase factor sigma-54 [Papillibacter cinnamivorans]SMC56360.1 RNA polymerase, sigma 54 subunit, RpoN/SigL [Papillibacter cinnamivorans DSM 12816]